MRPAETGCTRQGSVGQAVDVRPRRAGGTPRPAGEQRARCTHTLLPLQSTSSALAAAPHFIGGGAVALLLPSCHQHVAAALRRQLISHRRRCRCILLCQRLQGSLRRGRRNLGAHHGSQEGDLLCRAHASVCLAIGHGAGVARLVSRRLTTACSPSETPACIHGTRPVTGHAHLCRCPLQSLCGRPTPPDRLTTHPHLRQHRVAHVGKRQHLLDRRHRRRQLPARPRRRDGHLERREGGGGSKRLTRSGERGGGEAAGG